MILSDNVDKFKDRSAGKKPLFLRFKLWWKPISSSLTGCYTFQSWQSSSLKSLLSLCQCMAMSNGNLLSETWAFHLKIWHLVKPHAANSKIYLDNFLNMCNARHLQILTKFSGNAALSMFNVLHGRINPVIYNSLFCGLCGAYEKEKDAERKKK